MSKLKIDNAVLFGDGINDDYPAIQAMLDSRVAKVKLKAPKVSYIISKPLVVHSNQQLMVDRFAHIKLANNSNCLMIKNANPHSDENICVEGGIWDMNHSNQLPNPFRFPPDELDNKKYYIAPHSNIKLYEKWNKNALEGKNFLDVYCGMAMQFNGIKNFTLKNVTIKNPVVYGVQAANLNQFTIENITFDYTEGSPKLWNLDGVHLEGGCKFGIIRNLKGNCHDDMVALTANDSLHGEIDNIVIDGIFAQGPSHSAVRLLSYKTPVKNIRITNVFGGFYTYCIGITKYSGSEEDRGEFSNIIVDNVFANNVQGTCDVAGGNYPFIFIEGGLNIKNLTFNNILRDESFCKHPMFYIGKKTSINGLSINNSWQTNQADGQLDFIQNQGEIENLQILNSYNQGKKVLS